MPRILSTKDSRAARVNHNNTLGDTMKGITPLGIFSAVPGFPSLTGSSLINNDNGLIFNTELNVISHDALAVRRNWHDSAGLTSILTLALVVECQDTATMG
jgi:hypothetical protein